MKPGLEVCRPLLDYLALSHYWTKGPLRDVMPLVPFGFSNRFPKLLLSPKYPGLTDTLQSISTSHSSWRCGAALRSRMLCPTPHRMKPWTTTTHPSTQTSAGGLFPPLCSLRTEAWLQVQPLGCSPASPSARSRSSSWENAWTELGQSLVSRLGGWKEEKKKCANERRFWRRKMLRGILWKLTK